MNFDSGFLADTASLNNANIQNQLNDDLRSYMDKGDAVFAGEQGRDNVIAGVRQTLLNAMKEENMASARDAQAKGEEHDEFTRKNIDPIINNLKNLKKAEIIEKARYQVALKRLGARDNPGGAMARDATNEIAHMFDVLNTEWQDADRLVTGHPGVNPVPAAEQPQAPSAIPPAAGPGAVAGAAPAGAAPGAGAAPAGAAPAQEPVLFESGATVAARKEIRDEIGKIRTEVANTTGGRFAERKEKSARADKEKAIADTRKAKAELARRLSEKATEWDKIRQNYRDTTFRNHYNKYDGMASSYYTFTRATGNQAERNLATYAGVAKSIAEYTGVYNTGQFNSLADAIENNPYAEVRLGKKNYKDRTTDSLNEEVPNRFIKLHKTIVMNAFGEGVHNQAEETETGAKRIRMKLLSDFRGYRAKSQYTDNTHKNTRATNDSAAARGKMTPAEIRNSNPQAPVGTEAARMNLVLDEKGKNREFLFSEKSAEIREVKTKNGQTVKGFYSEGRFISADHTKMNDDSQMKGGGKELESISYEEKLRDAIRRSDFFRHINSGTIQHYMGYEAAEEFGQAAIEQVYQQRGAQANPGFTYSVVQLIKGYTNPQGDPQTTQWLQQHHLPTAHDANTLNLINIYAVNVAKSEPGDDVRNLGILLLSANDPDLWTIAKEMAENTKGKFGGEGRFKNRLRGLPASGEPMRIALMEEFARDRSVHWGSLMTYTSLPMELMPDRLQMHVEDLSAKRDSFFSFTNLRQSFWDGSLFSAMTGEFSLEGSALGRTDFSRGQQQYAESVAALNEKIHFLPRDIAIEGIQTAAEFGEFKPKTTGAWFNFFSHIYSTVLNLVKLVSQFKEIKDIGLHRELWPHILEIIETIADICLSIASMVACFMEETGTKLASGITSLCKDIVELIKNIVTLGKSFVERYRIHSSRKNIETAMTQSKDRVKQLRQQNPNAQINEASFQNDTEKMGYVSERNTQGTMFLSMARQRTKRTQITQSFDFFKNAIKISGDAVAIDSAAKDFDPRSWAFTLGAKAVGFIGWCVGKIYDKHKGDELLHLAIGNRPELGSGLFRGKVKSGRFDHILKRETGINNVHYLSDVARIFMAIDTHHLVRKGNKSNGETALVTNLMSPYLKMAGSGDQRYSNQANKGTNEGYFQNVKLRKLLEAVGAPSNWRAVLRQSITG
ncbi:MAG: hypothetical protein IJP84_02175 [Lachnospiraceae bacterium]|nr:hypothetical protein [Lachnospiraceae bacterium]